MYLRSIHLQHFRNYQNQSVHFNAPKTILVGQNAQGKSNLLEAVALLSTLHSQRASSDRELIQQDQDAGQISGELDRLTGTLELRATLRRSGRRTLLQNGSACRRQADFLGSLNAVEFSCLDLALVRGTPDDRRRWLDRLVMQLEPIYCHVLREYSRILKQRNALLRQGRTNPHPGLTATLHTLNQQLAIAGTRVIRRRDRALSRLAPIAQHWHHQIGGTTETLQLIYQPQLATLPQPAQHTEPQQIQQHFLAALHEHTAAEQARGISLIGPHRDDIHLIINGTPARQYGSQGQQRTLVLATKLAELELIEAVVGEAPLLLLDDVLAELDLVRQDHLLTAIEDRFQTLITTTHLNAFDAQWLKQSQILTVHRGAIDTATP